MHKQHSAHLPDKSDEHCQSTEVHVGMRVVQSELTLTKSGTITVAEQPSRVAGWKSFLIRYCGGRNGKHQVRLLDR